MFLQKPELLSCRGSAVNGTCSTAFKATAIRLAAGVDINSQFVAVAAHHSSFACRMSLLPSGREATE